MTPETNPRAEADGHLARAFQIVCDASDEDADSVTCTTRDYTPDELDKLFFSLTMASVQLAKVPGGAEAKDRCRARLKAELARRGEHRLSAEAELDRDAVELVKRAFGDDVDFGKGTSGYHLAKVVEAEQGVMRELRVKLVALASVARSREDP